MQRLGFPPTASLEHRKLAVDIADVIIKWEGQRIKDDEKDAKSENINGDDGVTVCDNINKRASDEANLQRKKTIATDGSRNHISQSNRMIAVALRIGDNLYFIHIRYSWHFSKPKAR